MQNARDKLFLHNILKFFVKREGKLHIILFLPITKLRYKICLHLIKRTGRYEYFAATFTTERDFSRFKTTRLVNLRIINKTSDTDPYVGWL